MSDFIELTNEWSKKKVLLNLEHIVSFHPHGPTPGKESMVEVVMAKGQNGFFMESYEDVAKMLVKT